MHGHREGVEGGAEVAGDELEDLGGLEAQKGIEEYLQSWWVIPPCLGITDEVPVARALRRVLFRLPKWAFDEVRNSIMVIFEDPKLFS